jgi:hypothetical protein
MFHCQLRRQAVAVLRATDGLEPKPLRFSEARGGVHRPPQGPGVVNLFSGRPKYSRPEGAKRWRRRRRRLTGARLLPFVDDFALFEVSYDETLNLKAYTFSLLTGLGLKIHPTKGHFDPILIGEHLGMIIDMKVEQILAPEAKLKQIAVLAKTLLRRAAAHKRWVNVKTLASLAGKAQFLHLAIPVAISFCGSYMTWSSPRSVGPELYG